MSTSMHVIVGGPDEDGIADALEAEGATVNRITGVISRPALEAAGIVDAELYVLTDLEQATTVPIAHSLTDNDDLRSVTYDRRSIPEFITRQLDLAIDPELMDPSIVAEELVG